MIMSPRVRKFGLVVHITSSVGWLGAAAAFFTLSAIGLVSTNEQTVRGVYLVMEPAARFILLPLGVASLLTGLAQSLGTSWGLFRNYWVLFKLLITSVSVLILWTYLATFESMARRAADPRVDLALVQNPSPMVHAGAALLGFLIAVVLSVYKPRGMTRYGQRKQHERRQQAQRNQNEQQHVLSRP